MQVDAGTVVEVVTKTPNPVDDPGGFLTLLWTALKHGYVGPTALFVVFGIGAWLRVERGYLVKKWPKLDDGKAWAVASIATVAAGTLVPLAISNALTPGAVWSAVVASVGLFIAPKPDATK